MLKLCLKYIAKQRYNIIFYLTITIIVSSLNIVTPLITSNIINSIVQFKNIEMLLRFSLYFAIINIVIIILRYIGNKIYIYTQTKIAFHLNLDLINHVQNIPFSNLEHIDNGYLNQRINNDSNSLTAFFINLINDLIINTAYIVISFIALTKINIRISIILLILGLVYIFMYIILKSQLYNKSMVIKENQANFFSALLMQLKDIKFIRTHSLLPIYQKKLNNSFNVFLSNILNSQKFNYFYSSLDAIISTLANIIVYIIGGISVINGNNTIGEYSIIISYFTFIITSFKYFCNLGKLYQDNMVSYNRITEIFDIKVIGNGHIVLPSINYINCIGLNFSRNNELIIKDFNYTFEKGHSYCIYGENGIGKTTLIELIIGLYPDELSGHIEFNSIDITMINMVELREKKISILEQKLTLLEGSIDDNIYLSDEHNESNISKKLTNEYIISDKIHGNINFDNSGISGGEAQKVALHRLLSKNADLYILDEPTSALDETNKNLALQIIQELSKESIVIVISHDKQVVNACDYSILLEK